MNVKVLQNFRDAANFDLIHEKGAVLDLEKERADRLQIRGLVEAVTEQETEQETEQVKETKSHKK